MNHHDVAVGHMSKEQLLFAAYSLSQQIADMACQLSAENQAVVSNHGRLVARLIIEVAQRDGIVVRPAGKSAQNPS